MSAVWQNHHNNHNMMSCLLSLCHHRNKCATQRRQCWHQKRRRRIHKGIQTSVRNLVRFRDSKIPQTPLRKRVLYSYCMADKGDNIICQGGMEPTRTGCDTVRHRIQTLKLNWRKRRGGGTLWKHRERTNGKEECIGSWDGRGGYKKVGKGLDILQQGYAYSQISPDS